MPRTFNGYRLRLERRRCGISVHDLADRVGRTCWTLYGYETGRQQPPLDIADALATALDVPLDELLVAEDLPAVA